MGNAKLQEVGFADSKQLLIPHTSSLSFVTTYLDPDAYYLWLTLMMSLIRKCCSSTFPARYSAAIATK